MSLIASFTPGVLERLGIGYGDLSACNPRIIVVEMPAFGPGGPEQPPSGHGKTMEAACGMTSLMGYGEGAPVLTGPAHLDPVGGLTAVAATTAALCYRDRTGRGSRVDALVAARAVTDRPSAATSPMPTHCDEGSEMTVTLLDYEAIAVTVDNAVATITLNRPDQLNAWDWQMHRELRTAYAALDASDEVRVIILTGAGRAFCAGAALAPRGETFDGSRDPSAWHERYPGPAKEVAELMTPVIAAINGAAVGAGITMAVACDLRIAAEDAKIGFVFNRRGVIPDADLLWSLPRMIGYARAMDLLLTGRIFTGREAAEVGLVSRAVPGEEVLTAATQMARDIADNVAPVSAAITKQLGRLFLEETDRRAALEYERAVFRWAGQQPDAREGVEAFLQRRPAHWQLSKHAQWPARPAAARG